MAWLCGIDEAGYGPNLGPMVTTLVAVPLQGRTQPVDLWTELGQVVRRAGDEDDERIIVNDSKAVYSPVKGLGTLERSVLTLLDPAPRALESLWSRHCLTPVEEREQQPWHGGALPLPLTPTEAADGMHRRLITHCRLKQIGPLIVRCAVIFPRQFNALADRHDSKGAVTQWAVNQLLEKLPQLSADHRKGFLAMDKLGGRNRYLAFLQGHYFGHRVVCRQETSAASRYRVELADGAWDLTIEPRADSRHFAVALASMFSKYVRELLMHQFNAWWCARQPGLEPTAGYPNDALRWWKDTVSLRKKLGVLDDELWRRR